MPGRARPAGRGSRDPGARVLGRGGGAAGLADRRLRGRDDARRARRVALARALGEPRAGRSARAALAGASLDADPRRRGEPLRRLAARSARGLGVGHGAARRAALHARSRRDGLRPERERLQRAGRRGRARALRRERRAQAARRLQVLPLRQPLHAPLRGQRAPAAQRDGTAHRADARRAAPARSRLRTERERQAPAGRARAPPTLRVSARDARVRLPRRPALRDPLALLAFGRGRARGDRDDRVPGDPPARRGDGAGRRLRGRAGGLAPEPGAGAGGRRAARARAARAIAGKELRAPAPAAAPQRGDGERAPDANPLLRAPALRGGAFRAARAARLRRALRRVPADRRDGPPGVVRALPRDGRSRSCASTAPACRCWRRAPCRWRCWWRPRSR